MDFQQSVILGRTGLKVGRIGIGGSYGVEAAAIEKVFHENGVNYLYYGSRRTEGMKQAILNLGGRHRDKLVITLQSYDRSGFLMPFFFERGLKSLKLDHADVLILGWHNSRPSSRVLEAALKLKQQGKVRYLAMSSHYRPLFSELVAGQDNPIDIFMVRYNAAHRGAEKEVFPYLEETGRPGVTAYTATRWGQLLNSKKMPPGELPLNPEDCYRFALSHPRVDLVLTGPRNGSELFQAVKALNLGPLNEAEMARVRRIGDHVHG